MSINIKQLTFIEYKTKRFYITQSPTNENIGDFLQLLQSNNIKHVIRLCEPIYDSKIIENENICFYDLVMEDGTVPDKFIIGQWNKIIGNIGKNEGVLVHCVAGLGRAPMMVTVSLINEQMEPYEAIDFIRKQRPGSINSKQLGWLIDYKPEKKLSTDFFRKLFCRL